MRKSTIMLLKPILKDGNHPLWQSIEHTFNCLTSTSKNQKYSYMDYYNMLRMHLVEGKPWGDIGVSFGMAYSTGSVMLPKRITVYLNLCNDVNTYIDTLKRI